MILLVWNKFTGLYNIFFCSIFPSEVKSCSRKLHLKPKDCKIFEVISFSKCFTVERCQNVFLPFYMRTYKTRVDCSYSHNGLSPTPLSWIQYQTLLKLLIRRWQNNWPLCCNEARWALIKNTVSKDRTAGTLFPFLLCKSTMRNENHQSAKRINITQREPSMRKGNHQCAKGTFNAQT